MEDRHSLELLLYLVQGRSLPILVHYNLCHVDTNFIQPCTYASRFGQRQLVRIENQVDLGLSRILEALLQYRVLFPQLTYLREHFVRFNLLTHHLDLGDEFSSLNHLFTQSGQVIYPYQGKRGKAEELEGYRCRRHVEHKKIKIGKLPFGLLKSQNESVFLQARRVLDHLEILLKIERSQVAVGTVDLVMDTLEVSLDPVILVHLYNAQVGSNSIRGLTVASERY